MFIILNKDENNNTNIYKTDIFLELLKTNNENDQYMIDKSLEIFKATKSIINESILNYDDSEMVEQEPEPEPKPILDFIKEEEIKELNIEEEPTIYTNHYNNDDLTKIKSIKLN